MLIGGREGQGDPIRRFRASNGPSGGQIMLIVIMLALPYGPSGGIVIFDTQDSNRKSHEIGESAPTAHLKA